MCLYNVLYCKILLNNSEMHIVISSIIIPEGKQQETPHRNPIRQQTK